MAPYLSLFFVLVFELTVQRSQAEILSSPQRLSCEVLNLAGKRILQWEGELVEKTFQNHRAFFWAKMEWTMPTKNRFLALASDLGVREQFPNSLHGPFLVFPNEEPVKAKQFSAIAINRLDVVWKRPTLETTSKGQRCVVEIKESSKHSDQVKWAIVKSLCLEISRIEIFGNFEVQDRAKNSGTYLSKGSIHCRPIGRA